MQATPVRLFFFFLLHSWGAANQVTFEPTKESFHVVSHLEPEGEDYKLLGVLFDCQLTMAASLQALVGKARWKLRSLLRSDNYHNDFELVKLYKSRLLGYLEYHTPAVHHASDTQLEPLNRV